MTQEDITSMRFELDTYVASLNLRHNYNGFLGKKNNLLERDLIMLVLYKELLDKFEITDITTEIPYKGNQNNLTSDEYTEIQDTVNIITNKFMNYNFIDNGA